MDGLSGRKYIWNDMVEGNRESMLSGLSRRKYNWNDGMDCSRDGIEDIGRWEFRGKSSDFVVAAFYNRLLLVSEMAVFPTYAIQQHRAHFRFVKASRTGGICIFNVFLSRMGEDTMLAVVTFLLRSKVSTQGCSIIGRGDFDKLL